MLILLPLLAPIDAPLDSPALSGAIVAVSVTDLDGKVVYERNAALRVMPASNQKLFSNSFALWELGPDYRPETRLWKQDDRTVVESEGDPLLTHDAVVSAGRRLELDRRLPVYVKEAYAPGVPSGWQMDYLPDRYGARVTAFAVDQGGFELWAEGGTPSLRPDPYGVRIDRQRPDAAKPDFVYDPIARVVHVGGKLPEKATRLDTLSVPQPDEAAASLLGSRFVTTSEVPHTRADAVIVGSPMREMLPRCLQPSDNNIAENLFLMGAAHEGPLGDDPYPTARERLRKFLQRVVGIVPGDVLPRDGSGLGRQNLVTARAITTLLRWSAHQPTADVWRNALAAPGKGTLRTRLNGIEFQGKTGSLNSVIALSGYLTTKAGKQLAFSTVLNHFACSDTEARKAIDDFVTNLASDAF